jgi:hypothetical protein
MSSCIISLHVYIPTRKLKLKEINKPMTIITCISGTPVPQMSKLHVTTAEIPAITMMGL